MLRRSITEFKGQHEGTDIWVIASGPTMNYVQADFFRNKITIGINQVYKHFPCTYLVRKCRWGSEDAFKTGIPLILSEYNCGNACWGQNEVSGPAWYFNHLENGCENVDLTVIGTDKIVVSYSTLTSALHLAAYLGAHNIVLCGHDCGSLDGNTHYDGYYDDTPLENPPNMSMEQWLHLIEGQTLLVKERLQQIYGCNIYSLNPFINPGLEGHKYEITPLVL